MLFLSKLLPLFVNPLGLALVLITAGSGLLLVVQKRAFGLALILAAAGLLWAGSMPVVANNLAWQLEKRFAPIAVRDAAEVDVIVLLGGLMSRTRPAPHPVNLGEAVDRAVLAAQLWKAGAARTILVSGGNLPWRDGQPEADLVKDLLVELGVSGESILLEDESRNTRENAVGSSRIWTDRQFRSGYLVTSAQHMQRALATFQKVGLHVRPAPTDFRSESASFTALDLLPSADALASTTSVIKEFIGLLMYQAADWA